MIGTKPTSERSTGGAGLLISLIAVSVFAAVSYHVGCGYSETVLDPVFRSANYRQYVRYVFMTIRLGPVLGCVAILAHLFQSRLFLLAGVHCLFVGPIIHFLTDYFAIFKVTMRVTWARGAPVALLEANSNSTTYQGLALIALFATFWVWKQHPTDLRGSWQIGQWDATRFVSVNMIVGTLWILGSIAGKLGVFAWIASVSYRLVMKSSIRQIGESTPQFSLQILFMLMMILAVVLAYHSQFNQFWNFWVHQ